MEEKTNSASEEKYLRINNLIMDIAMRGNYASLGPTDIYWKVVEPYVFALIIDYTGKWWYRIFTCEEPCGCEYDKRSILDTLDNEEDPQYIYGYYTDQRGIEGGLQKYAESNWLPEVLKCLQD